LAPRQRFALRRAFGMSDDAAASPDIWLVALATLTLLTGGAGHEPILRGWTDMATPFCARRFVSTVLATCASCRSGRQLDRPSRSVSHEKVPIAVLPRWPRDSEDGPGESRKIHAVERGAAC